MFVSQWFDNFSANFDTTIASLGDPFDPNSSYSETCHALTSGVQDLGLGDIKCTEGVIHKEGDISPVETFHKKTHDAWNAEYNGDMFLKSWGSPHDPNSFYSKKCTQL